MEKEKEILPKKTYKEFKWIVYDVENNSKTCNYMKDFLKRADENLDYLNLDLLEHEELSELKHASNVSNVADDIYKRLIKYG